MKVCEGAGRGFLTAKKNKGQDRWVETIAFGENSGTRRHFWSGEPGALTNVRGPRANRLAVDEAGFCHQSVVTTCLPMLGTRKGKAAFFGTASRGGIGFVYFKELFERGQRGEPGFRSFNFPIESNPYLTDETCAMLRRVLRNPRFPDLKTPLEAEECDGAFISDLGACFENLDACITLPYVVVEPGCLYVGRDDYGQEIRPEPGRKYVIGADWGQKHDNTVFAVFDRLTRHMVALRIEPTRRQYDEYVKNLAALKDRWNNALVISDSREAGNYAGQRFASEYGKYAKEIAVTGKGEHSKAALVARAKDLFLNEAWHLLTTPETTAQFSDFEQVPIGEHENGFHFRAPAGKRDDIVSACLLAATVLQIDPPRVRVAKAMPEPLSTEWFLSRQRARRALRVRRGFA